ncbi:conserved hypothetical protein [Lodderomyces elongisporus NRRL YB-4239]|uniref:Major facilitator superfamily (MFS) profile domain-containing protein n=1 Tax=Lodderomyces elongisporus (strain ATCC 11503 / CBS 2605 / JCM 1781 / NBRC 1676 / NRRL YB-4239) TaxID=379508 RepID=A5E3A3_LODEL|nr:conserved hypothetical protein [Lodderomyces elongisporus NRRL YB-4239]
MHLLKTLGESTLDIRLLWLSVFLRMASYGLTNQVLVLYLRSIKISPSKIGVFMTLTLIGDTLISYCLTWYADQIGRRRVMLIGSFMMLVSGIVFAKSTDFTILLLAAIIGVISPSGDETGPFKTVEEASIAHLTPHVHRPEVFAFHGVFATAGAALGSLIAGFMVDYLHDIRGWDLTNCYQSVFLVYLGFAIVKFAIMMGLSEKCEVYVSSFAENEEEEQEEEQEETIESGTEETPLIEEEATEPVEAEEISLRASVSSRAFGFSKTTRKHLPKLMSIFMLDSLGYGFMPSAWVIYYLKLTFELTASALGTLFFITNSVDAFSSLPSAYLSKSLGPVKAILFTQVPSSIFFGIIAMCQTFAPVAVLLVLYYTTTTMDVVPRQVFLTSIVPRNELVKVLGTVNIGKTFARCIGPNLTGLLAEHNMLHYGFVINAACVLLADFILATNFVHMDNSILKKQGVQ